VKFRLCALTNQKCSYVPVFVPAAMQQCTARGIHHCREMSEIQVLENHRQRISASCMMPGRHRVNGVCWFGAFGFVLGFLFVLFVCLGFLKRCLLFFGEQCLFLGGMIFFEDASAWTCSEAKCIFKNQVIDSLLNDT